MIRHSAMLLCLATPAMADAPRVVTDIAPVHSLVAGVMAGVGTPELLLDASVSPHTANLRPAMAQVLQDADAVFTVGDELTPWLTRRIETLAADAKTLELLEASASLIEPGEDNDDHADHGHEGDQDKEAHNDHDEHAKEGHEDYAHDVHDHQKHDDHAEHKDHDDHAGHEDHDDHAEHEGHGDHDDHAGHAHAIDPHAWLDPHNAAAWTTEIAKALGEIDPAHKDAYTANAQAQSAALLELAEQLESRFDGADIHFLSYHDAYAYFGKAFGQHSLGSLASNEGAAPSAADIKNARALFEKGEVNCIFTEPQFSTKLIETATEGYDIPLIELDPLGAKVEPGPELYQQLILNMADAFDACKG